MEEDYDWIKDVLENTPNEKVLDEIRENNILLYKKNL